MKGLLSVLVLLVSSSAFAGYTRYDSIHFQKNAAWVSASAVCQANGNLYATVTFDVSVGHHQDQFQPVEFNMVQPMNSTAVRCASTGRECTAWETYPLVQGGVVNKYTYRSIREMDENINATVTPYTIRSCGSLTPVPAN